jgi:hypothetical protein
LFNATLLLATFSGTIGGQNVTALINPSASSTGIVTFTPSCAISSGQCVDTTFDVAAGYEINGGSFNSTPLTGTSNSPVPGPTAGAGFPGILFGSGLVAWWRSRREQKRSITVAA